MTERGGTPWWYSGDEVEPPIGDRPPQVDAAQPGSTSERGMGVDLAGVLVGAQRLVEWATDTVLSPHAEHGDPRAHPRCVLCRVGLMLGEVRASAVPERGGEPGSIRWLDIHEQDDI